jgi:hypothetical protein
MTDQNIYEYCRKNRRNDNKDRQALFIARHQDDITISKTTAKAMLNCSDPILDRILKAGCIVHWRDMQSNKPVLFIQTASLLAFLEKEREHVYQGE